MKLNKTNYFSPEMNREYMGHSQFLDFCKCEEAALKAIDRDETTSVAFQQGHAFDDFFETPNANPVEIVAKYPLLMRKDGKPNTDGVAVLKGIERARKEPLFMEYASGQQQVIRTGEIEGVAFKTMIDSYLPNKAIVDRKFVKDFNTIWSESEGGRVSFIRYWGYDIQAAIYQAIEGEKLPFIIAAITKEPVPDIALIQVPQHLINDRLEYVKFYAPKFAAIKRGELEPERCGKCDHCKETKTITGIQRLEDFEPQF